MNKMIFKLGAVLLTISMLLSGASVAHRKFSKPSDEVAPGPTDAIEFKVSDDGDATGSKYIRAYCRNLAQLSRMTAQQIRTGTDDSLAIAKAYAAGSETARIQASKGVDARVTALFQATTEREDWAKFQDEMATAFERLGK